MTIQKHKRIKLQEARKRKGLSQKELAQRVGVSVEQIKSLEYGRVNPSAIVMLNICRELETTPEVVFSDMILTCNK